MKNYIWAVLWVLLNVLDYLITVAVIARGGIEANPLLAALSPPTFGLIKYAVPVLVVFLLYKFHREHALPVLVGGMAVVVYHSGAALLL